MAETTVGAEPLGSMLEAEKQLGQQSSVLGNVPNKVETPEPSSDDAKSSEKLERAEEEESTGNLRDYFVSSRREQGLQDCTTNTFMFR